MPPQLSLREMPASTIENLVPPRSPFPYFAHPEALRFDPDAIGDHAVNASWLADASLLVYGDRSFIHEACRAARLAEQGFALQFLPGEDDSPGMLLKSESAQILVFRGTRIRTRTLFQVADLVMLEGADLRTDSQFLSSDFPGGGKVHTGFLQAFEAIAPHLDALVSRPGSGQRLWLAGHSLGGALALLAAAHLGSEHVAGLYTFGCPRVGDAAFAERLPTRTHIRFVYRDDWIPSVPPGALGYVHAGTLHLLDASDSALPEEEPSVVRELARAFRQMAAQSRLDTGPLPVTIRGLADHAPVYYATLLWNAMVTQQGL